ncbi:hypothetical protein MNBD_GAMMA16-48 [hydrothermal vent metagenome]|uniref:G domain-containing protein n=1 Tax=hydrothermal vent metagenome TaxID=652676 RepID=A0A3B0ZBB2_9ZZZZ
MRNKHSRQKRLKVVILGEENVGKTTLVHQLSPGATSVENTDSDGTSVTVGYDLGKIEVGGYQLHLFGTPGQSRFKMTRHIVSEGADFGILLIDGETMSSQGMSDRAKGLEKELIGRKAPYLICINKMNTSLFSREEIQCKFSLPVHFISAKTGDGIEALKKSLQMLIEQHTPVAVTV